MKKIFKLENLESDIIGYYNDKKFLFCSGGPGFPKIDVDYAVYFIKHSERVFDYRSTSLGFRAHYKDEKSIIIDTIDTYKIHKKLKLLHSDECTTRDLTINYLADQGFSYEEKDGK